MTRIHNLIAAYHHWTVHVRLSAMHHFAWWAVPLLVVGLLAVFASAALLLDDDFRRMRRL
jgi:nitric oxide reductase large subunit